MQRCYDKDRTGCAQQVIAGNWHEPPASIPMSVQESFWRDLFETPSVPDSRSLPIIGEMHWELMHPITGPDGRKLSDVKAISADELAGDFIL